MKFTQNLRHVPDEWFGSFLWWAFVSINPCSLMTNLQISCKGSVYIPLQKHFTVVCGTCHLKQSKSLGDKLKWLFLLCLCSPPPSLHPLRVQPSDSWDQPGQDFQRFLAYYRDQRTSSWLLHHLINKSAFPWKSPEISPIKHFEATRWISMGSHWMILYVYIWKVRSKSLWSGGWQKIQKAQIILFLI